jgi:NCS2 family nucleobase:cation symporter-2
MGLIVLGIATFLHARRMGPLGTGFMCPATFTAAYFGPSLLAVKTGGLPLLFGMTLFAGVLEAALAGALNRLRAIFPTEISGLVIFMIGITAGIAGLRTMLGVQAASVSAAEWWVASLTLGTMVAFNVWGSGTAKMLCALIGLGAGYAVAGAVGLLSAAQLAAVWDVSWVAFPRFVSTTWSFDVGLVASFAVVSLAVAMKAAGTITVCQRMNDADWVRPDMRSVTRGVLTDGVATALAGVMGGTGTNTSTPSVGLAAATGVASRRVAYAIGCIFLLLGFMPKLAALLAVMPRSVMVAALIFTVCFIVINGLQIMSSRLLDVRRTIVIGLAIVAGVAIEAFPVIAASAPKALLPVVSSALVFSTLIALTLNLLFRIGMRKTVRLEVRRDAVDAGAVEAFLRAHGATWGARPEVISRATFGVNQLVEAVAENCWRGGTLVLEASFDEFSLDVRLTYEGEALEFPDRRPTENEIIASEEGARRLAGFMLRHNADRIRSEARGGRAQVLFHFDH